jgi:hypothetical protein
MRDFEHPRMRVSSSRELYVIKPAATSHTVRTLCFRYSAHNLTWRLTSCVSFGRKWECWAQSIVWSAKAAVEGGIAMKLNLTEPSVQAYIVCISHFLAVTSWNKLNRYAAAPTAM